MSETTKRGFSWGICILHELFGGFVGYCVSFFFQQNAFVREKLGFGGYVKNIFSIVFPSKRSLLPIEVTFIAWGGIFVGVVLFSTIYKMRCRSRRNPQPHFLDDVQEDRSAKDRGL